MSGIAHFLSASDDAVAKGWAHIQAERLFKFWNFIGYEKQNWLFCLLIVHSQEKIVSESKTIEKSK